MKKNILLFILFFWSALNFSQNLIGKKSEESKYDKVNKMPVYDGCDSDESNSYLKNCLSKKISSFIIKNLNKQIIKKNNTKNTDLKIFVGFKVNTDGEIFDFLIMTQNANIRTEITRVMSLLPKIEPGYADDGQPLIVPFGIPLILK